MWLIDTSDLQLKEFHECPAGTYAILSHTWGTTTEEPTFEEFKAGNAQEKAGFKKIRLCCEQARSEGLQYAWVDTCCIDKRNSTELSEAINSMFNWYQNSRICYVYLSDVSHADQLDQLTLPNHSGAFRNSRWFARGWTLQELIAPARMTFFTREWTAIGDKSDLAETLHLITGVDADVLALRKSFLDCSVAQRMSWAAGRETTRLEDRAYSLIGLFDVNLPMMYGEGSKAFLRLQQTIIEKTDDETVFAWTGVPDSGSGLLAPTPASFAGSAQVERGGGNRERPHYVSTNKGLAIECQLFPCEMNTYKVPLQCCWRLGASETAQIAIFIRRTLNDHQYRRVTYKGRSVDRITEQEASRAQIRQIFVPVNGHGLQLAPGKGLPLIHIQTNLLVWHIDQTSNNMHEAFSCRSAARSTLLPRPEPLIQRRNPLSEWDFPILYPTKTVEIGPCVPRRATRVQLQKEDLERGILLAIKSDGCQGPSCSHYLQIGFDADFRPTAIVRRCRFRLRCIEVNEPVRIFEWFQTILLELESSLWTAPLRTEPAFYNVKTSRWTTPSRSGPHDFSKQRPPQGCSRSRQESGHRFEGFSLDADDAVLRLRYCRSLRVSMRSLGCMDWEVQIKAQQKHHMGWTRNDFPCGICLRSWSGCYFYLIYSLCVSPVVLYLVVVVLAKQYKTGEMAQ